MKHARQLAAGAALVALGGVAKAQGAPSSVQVYGLLDVAVERVSNAPTGAIWRMPTLSAGMFPSRIGFRGSEDLGDGLRAIFTLESGLTLANGSFGQGGRAFGRQAWVGLAGPWGQVTAGRTYSNLFLSFFDVDVLGPSQIALANFDSYLPNARHDNSISYRGTFNGVTAGATYSFGRDASAAGGPSATNCAGQSPTDRKACTGYSGMLRYDASHWGALVAYDTFHGGVGAVAAFSPVSSAQTDSRTHAAGYWKLGQFKLAGGLLRRKNEASATTPKSDLSYFGVTWSPSAQIDVDAQVSRLDTKNSPNDGTLVAVRVGYNFSKRTTVYAMAGRIANHGALAVPVSAGASVLPGASQTSVLAGIKHSF